MRAPKLIDNKAGGTAVDELRSSMQKGSKLSIISAYFTIYAYSELKSELSQIGSLRFIFTQPTFLKANREEQREYYIQHNLASSSMAGNEYEMKLRNEMKQSAIAKECAGWLRKKAEIKSLRRPNPAQPQLIHVENSTNPDSCLSINGTVDFTTDGLGITPSDRETSLVGLIRVGLLKRMESSVHAFALTTEKILNNIVRTIDLIDHRKLDYDASRSIEEIDLDDDETEDLFGSSVKVLLQDMDLIKWRQDLDDDREKLSEILTAAKQITPERDEKLKTLCNLIRQKESGPINPGNRKVLIFSAFADTARYLYDNLSPVLKEHGMYSALVTGAGDNRSNIELDPATKRAARLSDLSTVLTLFSPGSKECGKVFPQAKAQIDVLFATDCISEGQNLQDCDYCVNYDIHWNPVRIIQRFGRIDRIGSKNKVIQLVNFWPMQDLDEYINLIQRVKGRMVLLDVSATGEENLIEDQGKGMHDLEYRRKQLQQLQTKVVDLEDISGGISITDLTYNDFKMDLMEYMKTHRKELEEAPSGLYAVAKIDDSLRDTVQPGVIFTLRQLHGTQQTKEQNPLFPYYMVYITEDGTVQLSFLHDKKILDYYKKCCYEQNEVPKDLVSEFNTETKDGTQMEKYSDLLEAAIQNLIGKKQEQGVASLFRRGGTTLDAGEYSGSEDFELISFLVLK